MAWTDILAAYKTNIQNAIEASSGNLKDLTTEIARINSALGSGSPTSVADGSDVTFGAKADSAATSDTGTFSFMSLFKRLLKEKYSGFNTFATTNYATATNAAATVTYSAAGAGISHAIDGIAFSLSANPASAVSLTVTDGSNTIYSTDILAGGAGFIPLRGRGSANTALTITLAAGGSGVVGKVAILNKWTI